MVVVGKLFFMFACGLGEHPPLVVAKIPQFFAPRTQRPSFGFLHFPSTFQSSSGVPRCLGLRFAEFLASVAVQPSERKLWDPRVLELHVARKLIERQAPHSEGHQNNWVQVEIPITKFVFVKVGQKGGRAVGNTCNVRGVHQRWRLLTMHVAASYMTGDYVPC